MNSPNAIELSECATTNMLFDMVQLACSADAYNKLLAESSRGSQSANAALCVLWLSGKPLLFPENKEEAASQGSNVVAWLMERSEAGNMYAMAFYADFLYYGIAVEKNIAEAFKWYHRAADQGVARAQNDIGSGYFNGNGIEKNITTAVEWYQKAADQGYAKAQYNLAVCYANGKGVLKNPAVAVKWSRQAAEQRFPMATWLLGYCYFHGHGVARNQRIAVEWFHRAANEGVLRAHNDLGNCYESQSQIKSTLHFCMAATHDEYKESLREKLTYFSTQERASLGKLSKELNWFNRRDFLMFLYNYTWYRSQRRAAVDMNYNVKCHVFAAPVLSQLIASFL